MSYTIPYRVNVCRTRVYTISSSYRVLIMIKSDIRQKTSEGLHKEKTKHIASINVALIPRIIVWQNPIKWMARTFSEEENRHISLYAGKTSRGPISVILFIQAHWMPIICAHYILPSAKAYD